jgi:hypothetical protein
MPCAQRAASRSTKRFAEFNLHAPQARHILTVTQPKVRQ